MWNRLFKSKSSKEGSGKKKKLSSFIKGSSSSSESRTSAAKPNKHRDAKVICDTEDVIDPGPDNVELIPCPICLRTFAPSALEKHGGICEKMHVQKRTPFDSFRQRREGTDLETYLPSNYGLIAKPKTSKLSPTDTKSVSRSISSVYDASNKAPSQRVTPTRSDGLGSKETPLARRSMRKQSLGPINEVCQHCGRSFGIRAFDRHVEWCAEKCKINPTTMSAQQHLAKERMQARTKYKAPTLRSKREKNREKYSSLSESMNNLSDSGGVSIMDFNSVADPYERGRKASIMSLSMTSSIASDGGFSDKYDPFISAKRQLDDLFNASGIATSTPSKDLRCTGTTMATSYTTKSPSSPTKPSHLSKSNFRRTSSLRIPSKKTSPISFMPKYKPTIQRGISDEGPISSNFMKPEEFDELPVKSHAVIPPDLVPKSPKPPNREPPTPQTPIVIKRHQSISAKRKNVCGDLKNAADFPLMKTDSLAAFLKFEDDLECMPSADGKLSEKELKDKSNKSLSELIDNKLNESSEFGGDRLPIIESRLQHNPIKLAPIEKPLIKHKIVLEPLTANLECNNNNIRIDENDNSIDSNLINSCDNLRISNLSKLPNESSCFDQSNIGMSGTIDGSIDNHLVTNTTNSNHNSTMHDSSIADTINAHQNIELIVNLKNISDAGKRNPKRQLQLRKDNLLFDNAITVAPTDSQIVHMDKPDDDLNDNMENDSSIDSSPMSQKTLSKIENCNEINRKLSANEVETIDSMFEDFDLEEFISSFSDNEQFPIFKNYKQMISTGRSTNRTQHGSESTSEESEFDDKFDVSDIDVSERYRALSAGSSIDREKCEQFSISPEAHFKRQLFDENSFKKPDVTVEAEKRMQIESELNKCALKKHTTDTKLNQLQEILDESGEMSQAERELLTSVQELNSMCDDANTLDLTSDVPSSNDDMPTPMQASFKSLFLRSPTEKLNGPTRFNRNRHQPILSYQMPEIVGFTANAINKDLGRIKVSQFENLLVKTDANTKVASKESKNASLNGFERVLPPIIVHKNDSQNIYNTINMTSSFHDGQTANRSDPHSHSASDRKISTSMSFKGKEAANLNLLKLSKFCHECGGKFIVEQAKFCMDCGVKRAVLD